MKAQIRKPAREGFGSMFDVAIYGDGLEAELLSPYEWTEAKVENVELDRGPRKDKDVPEIIVKLRITGRKATDAKPAR